MSLSNLEDLFVTELRDALSAEQLLVEAMPQLASAVVSPDLRMAIEFHLRETETHVDRLKRVFASIGQTPRAKTCRAMEGLLQEMTELIEEDIDDDADPEIKDAGLIAAAQKVEHYEIAAYGTLATWAKMLSYGPALELLLQTLEEEKATDMNLTELAKEKVNQSALD